MQEYRATIGMLAGAAGGAVAIGIMEAFSTRAAIPLMAIPFATSIVLVMGSPDVEAAQPRALIGGHILATIVGLLVVKIVGPEPWAAALAVGLATAAMHYTRTFHPPAGIDPLLVVVNNMPWSFFACTGRSGCGSARAFCIHMAPSHPPLFMANTMVVKHGVHRDFQCFPNGNG